MLNFRSILLIFLSVFIYQIKPAQEGLAPEVCVYLKTKEVPKELKEKLDKLFLSENVIKGLELLYNNGSESLIGKNIGIIRDLEKEGFQFFGKAHVFCHKSLPEFVFKIALINWLRSEVNNAGRIRYAELLNGKANNKIRTPKKYAYMPYIYRFNSDYENLPICIVVSQFIKGPLPINSLLKRLYSIIQSSENYYISILIENGYIDVQPSNYYEFNDHIMLIDTEPHDDNLDYPKIKSKL